MSGADIYIGGVFLSGVLSFFSPCIVPLLPLYLSYLTGETKELKIKQQKNKQLIRLRIVFKSFLFVFGISTIYLFIGFGAGAIGSIINSKWITSVGGAIVILMGLHQIGFVRFVFLEHEKKFSFNRRKYNDMIGAYLLGVSFSFGWSPCIGPILGSVLGITASEGSTTYGGFLLFIYSLGFSIPFLIITFISDTILSKVKRINKYLEKIKIVSGIVIILMGLVLMTNKVNTIIHWFV